MDAKQWSEAVRLFEAAVELDDTGRADFLARETGDDAALRALVDRMLASDGASSDVDLSLEALAPLVDAPIPTLAAGTRVGDYVIESELGRGGMGTVYLARDEKLGRRAALKFVTRPTRRGQAGLLDEARAASSLDHPNLATVYHVGETEDGEIFIAFPYYQGGTLADVLRREGAVEPDRAVSIASEIAAGLAAAHAAGLVHRDVKPSNVALAEDGSARLLDFGIATSGGQPGTAAGTPRYMSPEQALGRPPDPRSDVWGLGMVLREMLLGHESGERPRPDAPVEIPETAPGNVRPVLARALAIDPADRFPDAGTLLQALRAASQPGAGSRLLPRGLLVPAGLLLVILALTALVMDRLSSDTLIARGLIESGTRLVLADFEGDASIAEAATEAIRIQLAESDIFTVADRDVVHATLRRMELDPRSPITPSLAREVAEREGIPVVVEGGATPVGGGYLLSARVVETATGRELTRIGESVAGAGDLLDGLERLGSELRERLGESAPSLRRTKPLERATTGSIEALRKYSRAQKAHSLLSDDLAVALLEEAIALDSTFGMAWRKLAAVDPRRELEATKRAFELRSDMSDRERYLTTAHYHYVRRDLRRAETSFEALLEQYPNDWMAANNLGMTIERQGRVREATALYQRVIEQQPLRALSYGNRIRTLSDLGYADSAQLVIEQLAEHLPGHWLAANAAAQVAVIARDYALAEALLEEATAGSSVSDRADPHDLLANVFVLRGRLEEASRMAVDLPFAIDYGRAIWLAAVELDVRFDTSTARAILTEAQATIEAAGASRDSTAPDVAPIDLALACYEAGDVACGDALWPGQGAPRHASWGFTWIGKLAPYQREYLRRRALGDPAGALEAYRTAREAFSRELPDLDPAIIAHDAVPMHEALGHPDSVIAAYTSWLDRRAIVDRRDEDARIEPRAHERLGQLYEARGDSARARLHFARFVELWADADPALQPRVAEARRRLVALQPD